MKGSYALVAEMTPHINNFPLKSSMDVFGLLENIEENKSPPTREDLSKFTENLEQIKMVYDYLSDEKNKFFPLW